MNQNDIITAMVTELRRGTLSLIVLSQLSEPQYGYSLLQRLEVLNVVIDASTLYPMLRRLHSQGLLESEWDTQEARPRKYYVLSAFGKEIYEQLKNEWQKLNNEMKFLEEKI